MSLYGSPRWNNNSYRTVSRHAPLGQSGFWPARDASAARGQLTDPALVRQFVAAGRAVLTLESTRTGSRYTYRISTKKNAPGLLFVAVLTGADNTNSYTYLGYIRAGVYRHGRAKSKIGADAPSALAFDWFHRAIHQPALPTTLRVWHEGRCGKCAKKLTVPASVATGFGPDCAEALGIEWATPVCEAVAA